MNREIRKSQKLSTKIIVMVYAILIAIFAFVITYQSKTLTDTHVAKELNRSRIITANCEVFRTFIGDLRDSGSFDDKSLLASFQHDIAQGSKYYETKIYQTIPVVASWTAAQSKASELGYIFRVPKNNPRNPLNEPRPGVEKAVINYLEGKGSLDEIEKNGGKIIFPEDKSKARILGEIGIIFRGKEQLNSAEGGGFHFVDAVRVFRSIKLTQDCMTCHGDPKGEPDLVGMTKEGWKVGDVRGAFQIINPLDKMRAELSKAFRDNILIAILILITSGSLFYFYIKKVVADPIEKIVGFVKKFGEGDFSSTLESQRSDEIGIMIDSLNHSVGQLRETLAGVAETSNQLSASSESLSYISSELASSAEEMNAQSITVSNATELASSNVATVAQATGQTSSSVESIASMTEKLSSNFKSVANFAQQTSAKVTKVAEAGEQMSSGISNVAASIEEMTSSLGEVAKNTSQANTISQKAKHRAEEINVKMAALTEASKQIGKVINVINEIADQTNMLALNATIEAAGAGEAGKGFAVVAGEVKELARQSAEATDEIAGQIENIQTCTKEAFTAVEDINSTINDIAQINEMIAGSVREQTMAANDISRTIAENAKGAQQVSANSAEASKLVHEIANNTDEAAKTSSEVAGNIDELAEGAREIARSSNQASNGLLEISKNIHGINTAAGQTSRNASKTNDSSRDLSTIASRMVAMISRFKIN